MLVRYPHQVINIRTMVRLRRRSSFSEKPLQHELHGCPLHFEAQMVEVTSEWPEMHMAPGPPKKVGDATSKRRCQVVESVMDVQGIVRSTLHQDPKCDGSISAGAQIRPDGQPYIAALRMCLA